ncbi:unnamed protein product, partial [Durusdinium trenchii]
MDVLQNCQKRQEGMLQRKTSCAFPCGSPWVAEWFVLSPEYLVAFASRTSAKVTLCISIAAVSTVEAQKKAEFCISYALELGKAACDRAQKLLLRATEEREMQRWIVAINEAQELRRRDRNFVPMSVASELLAKQLQLTEEKAAESTRHAATARQPKSCVTKELTMLTSEAYEDFLQTLFASRSLAACLAATLAPKVATSLQQALDALRVLRASERACSASLRRLSFVLRNAALRSLHLGLVAFARTGACPCCQRLAFLCRAVEKGRSARGAAKQQALSRTLWMLRMRNAVE